MLKQVGEAETLLAKPSTQGTAANSGRDLTNMNLLPDNKEVCTPHRAP